MTPQRRAAEKYRRRLSRQGMVRFEVLAPRKDRELIRSLAKKLAGDQQAAAEIRASVSSSIQLEDKKGGILAALRKSPLVGVSLSLKRPRTPLRKVDL